MLLYLLNVAFSDVPPPPIVGGSTTNAYTEVGAIFAVDSQGYGGSFCSATLIHRYWILTAAHCIYGSDAAQNMVDQGYDIYFVTATDTYNASYSAFHPIHPEKLIPHPNYNGNTIENDIGLMQLSYPIDDKEPVPLNSNYSQFINKDIVFVGYGITGDGRNDGGVRRTTSVPYYTYDTMFLYTNDPTGQSNICSGDSGGAALIENSNGYILVGVNSFGFDLNGGQPTCEGPNAAAGATRVDQYLDFIEQHLGNINTDGGGTGGSGGSGGSTISEWEPPLADSDYKEGTIPSPAGCSTAARGASLWGFLLMCAGFLRRKDLFVFEKK